MILDPSQLIPSPTLRAVFRQTSILFVYPLSRFLNVFCCNVLIRQPHFILMFFPPGLPLLYTTLEFLSPSGVFAFDARSRYLLVALLASVKLRFLAMLLNAVVNSGMLGITTKRRVVFSSFLSLLLSLFSRVYVFNKFLQFLFQILFVTTYHLCPSARCTL